MSAPTPKSAPSRKRPPRAGPDKRAVAPLTLAGSDDTFTFTSTGGDIVLPSLAGLEPTFEMMEAIDSGDTQQIILTFLHAAATPAGLLVAKKLRLSELDKLFGQWHQHSGISAGESSAS